LPALAEPFGSDSFAGCDRVTCDRQPGHLLGGRLEAGEDAYDLLAAFLACDLLGDLVGQARDEWTGVDMGRRRALRRQLVKGERFVLPVLRAERPEEQSRGFLADDEKRGEVRDATLADGLQERQKDERVAVLFGAGDSCAERKEQRLEGAEEQGLPEGMPGGSVPVDEGAHELLPLGQGQGRLVGDGFEEHCGRRVRGEGGFGGARGLEGGLVTAGGGREAFEDGQSHRAPPSPGTETGTGTDEVGVTWKVFVSPQRRQM
jgi:hypothetical protein